MTKVRTAAIIGGGVAGPVAALALRKAGIEATIYEAYASTADGIGGTLAIAANGMAALEIVGAKDAVAAAGRPLSRMVMTLGRRTRIEVPSVPGVDPMYLLRRDDLHRALHERAAEQGIPIEYRKRLVDVEETPAAVTAVFADGSRTTADVLIGADGVHSTVRTLIDPAAPGPRYTGVLGFEAHADHDVDVPTDTITFAFGKRAYYLYWSVPGAGTVWGVNLPQERPMSLVEARAVPAVDWMRVLREVYGEDVPGGELMRHTDPDRLHVVGSLHIMPSVPHWYRGRKVLVGDAVHAPSNSSGQGASLAIESAVQLARCLRDIPDVPAAFAAYEGLRRDRVEKIAARAARINQVKAPGPIARALMPILLPLLMKKAMSPEKTVGPELRYRIDWHSRVTPG